MNKFSFYILLILIFLGISKSFSPSEKRTIHLENEKVYVNIFHESPMTLILLESFSVGFIIKTYYQRYKIVHAFKTPEQIILRTSKSFWEKNLKNHGMSLFSRDERNNTFTTPMPPGAIFIGDPAYGTWELTDYGAKAWVFHRTYKNFPTLLGWGDFDPTQDFYQKMKLYESDRKAFYGLNDEFGTNGTISKNFLEYHFEEDKINISVKDLVRSYFSVPDWENKTNE